MRALILVAAVAAAVLAGCGPVNPCANHAGVCVALRVEGSVKSLDQLAVSVDKPSAKTVATPVQAIALPIAIALDLPAGASGTVTIGVIGLGGGKEIASGGTTATISGGHASATVTLSAHAGGVIDLGTIAPGGDMAGVIGGGGDMTGAGQGSSDMAGCSAVSACINSDNCCPAACNNNNDNDCPVVCGNNVTEAGEVCDDGNTTAADSCDPTCQWHDKLDLISGTPGGFGFADGSYKVTRYGSPRGITYDATNSVLYVAGTDDCTIRKLSGTLITADSTTIAGSPWSCTSTNGSLTTARFDTPFDIELIGTAIYVAEPSTSSIRKIDLTAQTVTTVVSGVKANGLGHFGALLVFYDGTVTTGGLKTFNPATSAVATVSSISNFTGSASNVNDQTLCGHSACSATVCYVPCIHNVVQVTMSNGATSSFAGTFSGGIFTAGCPTYTAATTPSTPFTAASLIATDGAGVFYVSDYDCGVIKLSVPALQGVKYAGGPAGDYVDGVANASTVFNNLGGLAWVPSDGLYMADSGFNIIRRITTFTFTSSGLPSLSTENLAATPPIYANDTVAVASDGTFAYAINSSGRLLKITLATGAVTIVTVGGLAGGFPDMGGQFNGMVLISGTLYVSNNDGVIQSVKTDGSMAAIFAGTMGTTSPPGDGKGLAATINPLYLTTDGKTIFFNDSGKEVRSVDLLGNVHTIAGLSTSTDYVDATGSAAHFLRAGALASIDGKFLYIGDASNASVRDGPGPSAIRRVELSTQIVTTIAGSSSMVGHMDGPAKSALFNTITALTTDGLSLFVADTDYTTFGHEPAAPTIRQLDLATMDVTTMIGVPGQWSFEAGIGNKALVHFPLGLAFEPTSHSMFFFDAEENIFERIK